MKDIIPGLIRECFGVIIVREYRGIGIDYQLNGYNMETKMPIKKHYCNGGIRYKSGKKLVSLNQLRKQPRVNIVLNEKLPF